MWVPTIGGTACGCALILLISPTVSQAELPDDITVVDKIYVQMQST